MWHRLAHPIPESEPVPEPEPSPGPNPQPNPTPKQVWRRLAQLEASLGYCFREKRLLREVPLLNYCDYSYSSTHYGYPDLGSTHHGDTVPTMTILTIAMLTMTRRSRTLLT